jgi:hypothetical protein
MSSSYVLHPTSHSLLRVGLCGVILFLAAPRASARSPQDSATVRPWRVAVVAGGLGATIVAIHFYQQSGWWKDNRTSFHFQEDLKYGLNVDKLGHMYAGIAAAYIFRKSFIWAGLSPAEALWYGSGASLLFQTYVEIEDGFSTWGFDRVDWASDLAGALFPIGQHYWPPLRNFDMKFSYHKSNLINEPGGAGFRGQKHIMFDDYEGQTIWFAFNLRSILPAPIESYWPRWLWISLGYGARDIASTNPYRVYYLAFDLDMTKIIPQDTPFLRTLSECLNFFHLPLPAVRFRPGTIWYGMYF